MDFAPVWDQLVHSIGQVPRSGLLLAAVGAMVLGVIGSMLIRSVPALGKLLRPWQADQRNMGTRQCSTQGPQCRNCAQHIAQLQGAKYDHGFEIQLVQQWASCHVVRQFFVQAFMKLRRHKNERESGLKVEVILRRLSCMTARWRTLASGRSNADYLSMECVHAGQP